MDVAECCPVHVLFLQLVPKLLILSVCEGLHLGSVSVGDSVRWCVSFVSNRAKLSDDIFLLSDIDDLGDVRSLEHPDIVFVRSTILRIQLHPTRVFSSVVSRLSRNILRGFTWSCLCLSFFLLRQRSLCLSHGPRHHNILAIARILLHRPHSLPSLHLLPLLLQLGLLHLSSQLCFLLAAVVMCLFLIITILPGKRIAIKISCTRCTRYSHPFAFVIIFTSSFTSDSFICDNSFSSSTRFIDLIHIQPIALLVIKSLLSGILLPLLRCRVGSQVRKLQFWFQSRRPPSPTGCRDH